MSSLSFCLFIVIWITMFLIREDTFDVKVLLTLLVKKSICTQYMSNEHRSEIFQVIVQEQFEE